MSPTILEHCYRSNFGVRELAPALDSRQLAGDGRDAMQLRNLDGYKLHSKSITVTETRA
jgi:hypothetical protein